MIGINQFHKSLTGQASTSEKIGQAIIVRIIFKIITPNVIL